MDHSQDLSSPCVWPWVRAVAHCHHGLRLSLFLHTHAALAAGYVAQVGSWLSALLACRCQGGYSTTSSQKVSRRAWAATPSSASHRRHLPLTPATKTHLASAHVWPHWPRRSKEHTCVMEHNSWQAQQNRFAVDSHGQPTDRAKFNAALKALKDWEHLQMKNQQTEHCRTVASKCLQSRCPGKEERMEGKHKTNAAEASTSINTYCSEGIMCDGSLKHL